MNQQHKYRDYNYIHEMVSQRVKNTIIAVHQQTKNILTRQSEKINWLIKRVSNVISRAHTEALVYRHSQARL